MGLSSASVHREFIAGFARTALWAEGLRRNWNRSTPDRAEALGSYRCRAARLGTAEYRIRIAPLTSKGQWYAIGESLYDQIDACLLPRRRDLVTGDGAVPEEHLVSADKAIEPV